MRTRLERAIRDESGKVFILVLALLVVGGLILGPVLGLMGTGLSAGQVYEKKTHELYAADAGVEDAIWRIRTDNLTFDESNLCHLEPLTVNDKTVEVQIYRETIGFTACHSEYRYHIVSEAGVDGSTTRVEAVLSVSYVLPMDFSSLLDYAVLSDNSITLEGSGPTASQVYGDVYLPDRGRLVGEDNIHSGEVRTSSDFILTWPTAEQLSTYYWPDVGHLELQAYPDGSLIDVSGGSQTDPRVIGPLYGEGNLTIEGDGWVRLDGTIYVKGNLSFGPGVKLDLDGQTVFAEGEIKVHPQVKVYGSGCTIAVHDVFYQPIVASDLDHFVLVLSVEGEARLLPGASFYGTLAGRSHAQLQPRSTATRPTGIADPNINFPTGGASEDDGSQGLPISELSILSWQIQPRDR